MLNQSDFNKGKTSMRYIWRDLLQGTGVSGYRGWLGKSDICRAGQQEEQAGTLGQELKLL